MFTFCQKKSVKLTYTPMDFYLDNAEKELDPFAEAISPLREIIAYEFLWTSWRNSSFKKFAEMFANNPGKKPSDLVKEEDIEGFWDIVLPVLSKSKPKFLINNTFDYPQRLRDAKEPVEVLYFKGDKALIDTPSVAVVGSRNPSAEGLKRAARLTKLLVQDQFTIVSGLAAGIDSIAHRTAIENNGKTIGVIGTPLDSYYPRENKELQDKISKDYLLISQVPFHRYSQQNPNANRWFFPERNKTMSALTLGTIIVEAGETSGTLIQAKAALEQNRKLFILDSCFQNSEITWPKKFESMGAIRVREYEDIKKELVADGI
jgi:DNA processing protein